MASGSTTEIPLAIGPATHIVVPPKASHAPILPLEQGDHLTRAEFERRYEAMPEIKKAELVEGVVYMPSPVSTEQHGMPDSNLGGWLFYYRVHTPGTMSPHNATVRLDQDNEPQPDNVLMIRPDYGGQTSLDANGYTEGAPELVAEISASSVSIDLHSKLKVYRRNGVKEYIVWRVFDRAIDWFVLRSGEYVLLAAGPDGILTSETFPGLWLNVAAMLEGKLDVVLTTLQQGLASAEHEEFVRQLEGRRKG
jgi:Uma2 family endonuclease